MKPHKHRGPRINSRFRGSKQRRAARISHRAGVAYTAFYEGMKGARLNIQDWRYVYRLCNVDVSSCAHARR